MTDGFEGFSNVKGGQKHLWLQNHAEFVSTYYQEFGEQATRLAFKVEKATLERLLKTPRPQEHHTFSKADKALAKAEITQAGLRQLTSEVRELRELFKKFQTDVGNQLVKKFFLPLLQAGITTNENFNPEKKEDPLRIDNVDFKQLLKSTQRRDK